MEHAEKEIETKAYKLGYKHALTEIEALNRGLADGWGETEVQSFLKTHPHLQLGRHRAGHGTFAFPELQLGNRYRVDWAVANGSSAGLTWELIELESPLELPFKKDGHLSRAARRGVEQIRDWRSWIEVNADHAGRPIARGGLGLHDCVSNTGVVVVGRRATYELAQGRDWYDPVRRTLEKESRISLISYDTFIESLRFRFEESNRQRFQ
jgi:hypothetical protein